MILELRILLNSWSIWWYNGGSAIEAVVRIAKSKNGDILESDGTVDSDGNWTKGKYFAIWRKDERRFSAWSKVTFRCSKIAGRDRVTREPWDCLISVGSLCPKNCIWCSCRASTSSLVSREDIVGRSMENSESPKTGEMFLWDELDDRLKGPQLSRLEI